MTVAPNTVESLPPDNTPPRVVAYENFQAVVSAKTSLEGQVSGLKAEIQKLTEKAATVDALAAQVNEWKQKASDAEGAFSIYSELSAAIGTTDSDIIGTFDQKWRTLPEAGRPARGAWVESLRGKPEDAPAVLRPWLSRAQDAPSGPEKRAAPRPSAAPPSPPVAPSSTSPEEIRRIREEAVKTGDWSRWREAKKGIFGGR